MALSDDELDLVTGGSNGNNGICAVNNNTDFGVNHHVASNNGNNGAGMQGQSPNAASIC